MMRLGNLIYMDYQASTPVDARVKAEMDLFYNEKFGNPHSLDHIMGWEAESAIETAKLEVAALIGATQDEIVFTSGATESNNHAILGVAAGNQSKRKRILVGSTEHKCVLSSAEAATKYFGTTVEQIPVKTNGEIDETLYLEMLDDDVLLVSIMAVNNEVGIIQNIKKLTSLAHQHGALFHCDAAQAPVAMDIDVGILEVDFLSLSAHKIYGPKGIGALYISADLISSLPPLIHGGGQQTGLRAGTLPTQLCVGFGKAAEIVRNSTSEREKLLQLKKRFLNRLLSAGVDYQVNGYPGATCHPGNLSICFAGTDAHSVLSKLQPYVCASTGSACNSGTIESSYVLRALGLDDESAASTIRFSIGRYSDSSQIDDVVVHIEKAIASDRVRI